MRKLPLVALLALLAGAAMAAPESPSPTPVPGSIIAERGQLLYTADGAHLGAIYRVAPDGSAQLIVEGKLVTIPADTLATVDGKLTTRLTKHEVHALH